MPIGSDVPTGSFIRTVVGAFSELERALISERTKAALAVARSQGKRLGRPSRQSPEARELAAALRAEGLSLRKIAAALTEAGIPTATGKSAWSHASVQVLLRGIELDKEAEANAARYAAEQRGESTSTSTSLRRQGSVSAVAARSQSRCCAVGRDASVLSSGWTPSLLGRGAAAY